MKKMFYYFSLILMLCLTLFNTGFVVKANEIDVVESSYSSQSLSGRFDLTESCKFMFYFDSKDESLLFDELYGGSIGVWIYCDEIDDYFLSYELSPNIGTDSEWFNAGMSGEFLTNTFPDTVVDYESFEYLFNVNYIDLDNSNYNGKIGFSIDIEPLFNALCEDPTFVAEDIEDNCFISIGVLAEDVKGTVVQVAVDKDPVVSGEAGYVTSVTNPVSVEKIKEGISAWDNEDGDVTDKIVIVEDNYTQYKNELGTYTVKFSVTDSASNTSYLTVTVLVADSEAPVITYKKEIIEISYTHDLIDCSTYEGMIEFVELFGLEVTDNHQLLFNGTIPLNCEDCSEYYVNYNRVGVYDIILRAEDMSANVTEVVLSIKVIDDIVPVFSGPTTIMKNTSDILTASDVTSQLSVTDYIDGLLTSSIKILEDNYTGHANKKGTYSIIFAATDNSGNQAIHEVIITVVDNIPPVFYIDSYFIQVSELEVLTNEQIVELLIASGQIENSATKTVRFVTNSYTGHENEVGIYPVQLKVRGTDGSEDVINLAVKVVEDENAPSDGDIVIEGENEFIQFLTQEFWFGWAVWIWLLILFVFILIIIVSAVAASNSSKKPKRYRW